MPRKRIPYNRFINSPEWFAIRRGALERVGHKCERCGVAWSDFVLHVHHLTYARFGGAERPEDLQVLCEVCHGECHGHTVLLRTPRGANPKTHSKAVKRKRNADHWKRVAANIKQAAKERERWVGVSIKDRY